MSEDKKQQPDKPTPSDQPQSSDQAENARMKRSVLSGLFWQYGESLTTQGVSFIVSIVLSRLLLPTDFGVVALAMVFVSLADVFVTSGLNSALIQNKDADDLDFCTVFYCSFVLAWVLYAILFFAAPAIADFYNNDLLVTLTRVFALRLPLSVYNSIQHTYVSRHMIFRVYFFSSLGGTLVSAVVGIVMAYMGFGVWALVAQSFFDKIADTVVCMFTVPWRLRAQFSWKRAKPLISYGWKVLGAELSGTFFGKLRDLIIGHWYSAADLAFYNRGDNLSSIIAGNINNSLMGVTFPAMSNYSDDLSKVKHFCRRSLQTISYVTTPFLIGLAAVAYEVVLLLYGPNWLESVPFARILAFCSVVDMYGIIPLQALKAIGRSDVVLKLEVVKKPAFVLLLVLGVRQSVLAVAWTMLIYDFYGDAVNMYQLQKYVGYSIREQLADILPATALAGAMGVAVALCPVPGPLVVQLVAKIALGVGIYVGASVLLHFPTFYYVKDTVLKFLGERRG